MHSHLYSMIIVDLLFDRTPLTPTPPWISRRRFGAVLSIIPIANSVTKLTARCELYHECAFFTLRKTRRLKQNLLLAPKYMPLCRKRTVIGQVVKVAVQGSP
ncbi:unnamed protein product [Fraxinus pennsylvanica]|uniref:Thymidine kinase n=1 Tax=Fraxinus pennsylvanica TaxID=56036 RepID=A0AAD1YZE1_9LAMI|nr:unnamed protein product [Fraxinus pennsylvanica]